MPSEKLEGLFGEAALLSVTFTQGWRFYPAAAATATLHVLRLTVQAAAMSS